MSPTFVDRLGWRVRRSVSALKRVLVEQFATDQVLRAVSADFERWQPNVIQGGRLLLRGYICVLPVVSIANIEPSYR